MKSTGYTGFLYVHLNTLTHFTAILIIITHCVLGYWMSGSLALTTRNCGLRILLSPCRETLRLPIDPSSWSPNVEM